MPFLDKILFTRAVIEGEKKEVKTAEKHYTQAIRKSYDSILKVCSYEALAKMKLDNNEYLAMSKYYDSILMFASKKGEKYFSYKQKRKNLEAVIEYETILKRNDSLIKIASLPRYAKQKFFEEKIKAKKSKQEEEEKKVNKFVKSGHFYFYNTIALEEGRQDFVEKWGKIPLSDNWKYNADTTTRLQSVSKQKEEEKKGKVEKTELETYMKESEMIKLKIDSIKKVMNATYYQLALFYKNQFNNYELAEKRLKSLLSNQPKAELKLATKYYLYLIYSKTDGKKAFFLKQDIIKGNKDSFYAKLLINEGEKNKELLSEMVDTRYDSLYQLFLEQKYQKLIELANSQIIELSGSEIIPKIELLRAVAIGKLRGVKSFRKELEHIKRLYSDSFEAKFLELFQKKAMPTLSKAEFEYTPKETNWKLSFITDNQKKDMSRKTEEKLEKGEIISETDFRIDGELEGDIKVSGKLVIGKTGTITGKAECEHLDIEGTFTGEILVKGLLSLKSSANFDGNVVAGKLAVEEGATFNATCDMKNIGVIQNDLGNTVKKDKPKKAFIG
ncbi:protein involved in gliding motility SprE [Elysia marginata]|uniref:Protein involved in gliding motility SprE n=1 Tax=Elysia marginata TaxID=1093978 RepID=A0AAV4FNG0_9GAST|nr:protein involved in gliding motility SprE [Elysia marginata]